MRWIGACTAGCVCDRCWDHGDECGHSNGTCSLTATESFRHQGWEARMAARARARQVAAEAEHRNSAEAKAVAAYEATQQRDWLNGWHRHGNYVLIGTGLHCVCCGRCTGSTCVVFPDDWEPLGPTPVWPFGETDCPLCAKPPRT